MAVRAVHTSETTHGEEHELGEELQPESPGQVEGTADFTAVVLLLCAFLLSCVFKIITD